jgi:RNA polymerase sigma-70 factor (ECF subfamily)
VYRDAPTVSAARAPTLDAARAPTEPRPLERARRLPSREVELGALLEGLRPRMLAVAVRFTRDSDVAHDVVQGAFEKALRHRDQFRGQARVSTWLHRIVANEALMWLRGERRRARRVARLADATPESLIDPTPDAGATLAGRQMAHRLRQGIARLGPEERDVIERCVLPGRSYAEYGAERGVHPAAAKSRAFRARRRLEALLQEA